MAVLNGTRKIVLIFTHEFTHQGLDFTDEALDVPVPTSSMRLRCARAAWLM